MLTGERDTDQESRLRSYCEVQGNSVKVSKKHYFLQTMSKVAESADTQFRDSRGEYAIFPPPEVCRAKIAETRQRFKTEFMNYDRGRGIYLCLILFFCPGISESNVAMIS